MVETESMREGTQGLDYCSGFPFMEFKRRGNFVAKLCTEDSSLF